MAALAVHRVQDAFVHLTHVSVWALLLRAGAPGWAMARTLVVFNHQEHMITLGLLPELSARARAWKTPSRRSLINCPREHLACKGAWLAWWRNGAGWPKRLPEGAPQRHVVRCVKGGRGVAYTEYLTRGWWGGSICGLVCWSMHMRRCR